MKNVIQTDGLPLELLKQVTVSKDNQSWTYKDGNVRYLVVKKNGRAYFSAMRDRRVDSRGCRPYIVSVVATDGTP